MSVVLLCVERPVTGSWEICGRRYEPGPWPSGGDSSLFITRSQSRLVARPPARIVVFATRGHRGHPVPGAVPGRGSVDAATELRRPPPGPWRRAPRRGPPGSRRAARDSGDRCGLDDLPGSGRFDDPGSLRRVRNRCVDRVRPGLARGSDGRLHTEDSMKRSPYPSWNSDSSGILIVSSRIDFSTALSGPLAFAPCVG